MWVIKHETENGANLTEAMLQIKAHEKKTERSLPLDYPMRSTAKFDAASTNHIKNFH
jgi:hypothetical protein